MKQKVLLIILFFTGHTYAQNELKSEQIAKEIHFLELENNKLILNQYIAEQTDSTKNIPIFGISVSLVNNFQNKHADIKSMRDNYELVRKQQDSIKNKDPEYKKINKTYIESSFEEKRKLEGKFNQIYNRLCKENLRFKELVDKGNTLLYKTNYAILVQMANEYELKGEVLPTSFIPSEDLYRYTNNIKVRENTNKLNILNLLYRKVLENELKLKFAIDNL